MRSDDSESTLPRDTMEDDHRFNGSVLDSEKERGHSPPGTGNTDPELDAEVEAAAEAGAAPNELVQTVSSQPPDGGFAAWSVVIGAWCCSFCSFGWLNSIGIFQEYYERNLLSQYSASTIAWIPSLQVFFMAVTGPFAGYIYDHYGPRSVILVGAFMHVFGIMMTSIAKEYYQILLAQGVCSAIGAATIFQPAISCVGGWFHNKRATAFGITMTGSSTGGVLFPIMVTHLIREVGFGWSMRICGFLILFLLTVAALTVRNRVKPPPMSMTMAELTRPFGEIVFVILLIAFAVTTFGIYVPVNYLVVASVDRGMSVRLGQYLVSIFNATSLFGRVGAGLFGDRLGRYNTFVVVTTISGILVLALWIPNAHNVGSILFAILFGGFSGAYISLSPALVAQISPHKEFGYRSGLLFASSGIPGLVTSPIAGAILSRSHGSYTTMKVYAGVFILAGAAIVALARVMKTGPKLLAKF